LEKIIRIFSFLTVLLLMAFSGCSGNRYAITSQPGSPGNTETIKSVETDNVKSVNEPSYEEDGLSADTLILTVDSNPVYWPEFHFWLNYIEKYYRNYHPEAITSWNAEQNGMSLNDFFLSCAVGYACKDRAIEAKSKELGIELSVRDLAEIENKRKSDIQIYGSVSEYLHIVSSMYVSEEVFEYLTKIDYLGNYLFERLYGAKGEKCTDEEISAYVRKQGFMCSKYIFLSNTDSDGKELSEEKLAENQKLLEDFLSRLQASDDRMTLFDATMKEYGNDMEISNYPDGRLFVPGSMGEEFESAFLKLKETECSGIVKASAGCYVILRMPIFPDMAVDSSGNTLRYSTAYDYMFRNQIEALTEKMEIKYEDAYYKLKLRKLSEKGEEK